MYFTHSLITYFILLSPLSSLPAPTSITISFPISFPYSGYFIHSLIPYFTPPALLHSIFHSSQCLFQILFLPGGSISSPSAALSITISFPCGRYFICTLIPHLMLLFHPLASSFIQILIPNRFALIIISFPQGRHLSRAFYPASVAIGSNLWRRHQQRIDR